MQNTNYTQEMTDILVQAYVACPKREVVDQYAQSFNKSPRSIIAKLVREGVYQAPEKTTKAGDPIVRKQDLVKSIEAATGLSLSSLEKASKADLQKLSTFIETSVSLKEAYAWNPVTNDL